MIKTIAASGHRLWQLENHFSKQVGYDTLIAIAKEHLIWTEPQTVQIISGMAEGWDLAVAQAALDFKIPLICAVPFSSQTTGYWKASLDIWADGIKHAKEVRFVSHKFDSGTFQRRNEWMVDRADEMIVLFGGWNGGTRNCLQYQKRVKPQIGVVNCWPTLRKALAGGCSARHVTTR